MARLKSLNNINAFPGNSSDQLDAKYVIICARIALVPIAYESRALRLGLRIPNNKSYINSQYTKIVTTIYIVKKCRRYIYQKVFDKAALSQVHQC